MTARRDGAATIAIASPAAEETDTLLKARAAPAGGAAIPGTHAHSMTPTDRQTIARAEFERAEQALADKLKARDEVVDKALQALGERIDHKHANAMQALDGFRELAEQELRPLTGGDEGVPVLRVRVAHLERDREEDRKRIDDLRIGMAKIIAIGSFCAGGGGLVTWILGRILDGQ